jgi:purine-binding chemotaxis protein CheW
MSQELQNIISKVSEEVEAKDKKFEKLLQLVVFELDKEKYAVEITDVREVIKIQEITPIPNAQDFIKGILNLRGRIIVAIDLEKRFHLQREHLIAPKHIMVTEVGENNFGVIVDEVSEIVQVPVTKIQPVPSLISAKIHADYLEGVVVLDDMEEGRKKESATNLLILLDLPKLLQEKELLALGKTIQEAVKK